ncbi:MAG TPA: S8 family serine peptidase [Micromonosporaceae bacterium]|nr:S8 family serine peptidase [Micromonosporaceae bacterium]
MHRAFPRAVRILAGLAVCTTIVTGPLAAVPGYAATTTAPTFAVAGCATSATPPPAVPDPSAVPWAVAASGVDGLRGVANGAGEVVAVIDSGVTPLASFGHRVLAGHDLLGRTDGRVDCVGHGTAVASIIAAGTTPGAAFRGLAPGAKILPVRVSEAELVDGAVSGDATTPAGLGAAITWAVDHGADVLNISVVVGTDDRTLRSAVARAVADGVVVVASVGNNHNDSGTDPTPYPAAYPGVIGVGSIDEGGVRSATSEVGPFLDVVAPGGGVTADRLPSGLGTFDGTSFAVPYVAATAALVRQEFPRLTNAQVAQRIFDTTDPPPVGASPADYGQGIVDPYRAVASAVTAAGSGGGHVTSAAPTLGADAGTGTPAAASTTPGRQRWVVGAASAVAMILLGFAWTLAGAYRRRLDRIA